MKVHITFLLLIFSFQANIFSQALFVGPMLHYNFGAEKNYFSYGIEASLWYQSNHYRRPLYGIDFGYEFNETSKRLYSEIQLMAMFAGISNGIVMEWGKDQTRTFGYQGSAWFAFFGGVDARFRRIQNKNFISTGIFGKIPLYVNGNGFNFN